MKPLHERLEDWAKQTRIEAMRKDLRLAAGRLRIHYHFVAPKRKKTWGDSINDFFDSIERYFFK